MIFVIEAGLDDFKIYRFSKDENKDRKDPVRLKSSLLRDREVFINRIGSLIEGGETLEAVSFRAGFGGDFYGKKCSGSIRVLKRR